MVKTTVGISAEVAYWCPH